MTKTQLRNLQRVVIGAPVVLVILFLSYLALRPDAAAGHFYRAQRLQAAGQEQQALRIYQMLAERLPDSSFAPLALQQQGEILTALARRSGEMQLFREAIAAYEQLASEYSSHSGAGQALMAAGQIALNDLRDPKTAARFYKTLLDNYAGNPEYASEATLRLGRIALQAEDATTAQKHFARVIAQWSRFPERCAEAQYHAGVMYETLLKNPSAARSAYEATIKRWPRSVWAVDAKERLGLMTYGGTSTRPARRVLIEVAALPKTSGDSRAAALRLVLAARGLELSDTVWRGWSLTPFRAGFAPGDPGRVLTESGGWEDIAANAGLTVSSREADDAARGLSLLRDELDAGHLPMVNLSGWVLAVGYDSSRDEIFVRRDGTALETLNSKEFAQKWRSANRYSLLTFRAPGETPRAQIEKPAASTETTLLAPRYSYKLPNLSLSSGHRRALRRAALLMARSREGEVLLNTEALRAVKAELDKLVRASDSPVPAPETQTPDAQSTPLPDATPQPTPATRASNANVTPRWKNLRKWFQAPLKNWIETRRDAAAFLGVAANDLNDAKLQSAAAALREAMNALETAQSTLPPGEIFDTDPEMAQTAMAALAFQIQSALDAETRATSAMR